jgi:hypothetical protein
MLGEPAYTLIRNDLREIGRPLDAIAKEVLISGWFASRSWIEADRERARRVVAAIYESNRWANAHRPETLAIFANMVKQSLKLCAGSYARGTRPLSYRRRSNPCSPLRRSSSSSTGWSTLPV